MLVWINKTEAFMKYTEKEESLIEFIKKLMPDGVAVAFSGGVDSTLILKAAKDILDNEKNFSDEKFYNERSDIKKDLKLVAFTLNTILNPKNDLKIAKSICDDFGVKQVVINVNEIKNPKILSNDKMRCYYCKNDLFSRIFEEKSKYSLKYVIDGSNFDDKDNYRPGSIAAKELGVISPLEECGFTKNEVREFAKKLEISVANRASAPCMLTRYPYDTKVDFLQFDKIEELEGKIKSLGIYNVRVRVHGDIARVEVDKDKLAFLAEKINNLIPDFERAGFKYTTIDARGFRSGSMDE